MYTPTIYTPLDFKNQKPILIDISHWQFLLIYLYSKIISTYQCEIRNLTKPKIFVKVSKNLEFLFSKILKQGADSQWNFSMRSCFKIGIVCPSVNTSVRLRGKYDFSQLIIKIVLVNVYLFYVINTYSLSFLEPLKICFVRLSIHYFIVLPYLWIFPSLVYSLSVYLIFK